MTALQAVKRRELDKSKPAHKFQSQADKITIPVGWC